MMQQQLSDLAERARAQTAQVEDWTAPLDDQVFLTRPLPGKWSVGEHLTHLTLTNRAYLSTLDDAVAQGRSNGWLRPGPYGGGWLMDRFVRGQAPPVTRRLKTFKKVMPPPELVRPHVVQGFLQVQADLEGSLEAADGVDLERVRIRSPLLSLIRMTALQGFELLIVHNDRHIWHIRQTIDLLDSPT